MLYMVKEVADLAGVSVRTLHYYDRIGLLVPASVSSAGYRQYSEEDVERLQQILFFKELDFSLDEIKEILASPGYDRRETLRAHRDLLLEKQARLERIIQTVEQTIQNLEGGRKMTKKEMFDGFDMSEINKYKEKYAKEVRQKYDPKVVEECEQKTGGYTKKDWNNIQAESDGIYKRFVAAMEEGPDSVIAQEVAGEWRQHITDNFYDCTLAIFRGLGDLYVDDPRFSANIDKYKPGLAQFMREAMHIYCDRQEQENS